VREEVGVEEAGRGLIGPKCQGLKVFDFRGINVLDQLGLACIDLLAEDIGNQSDLKVTIYGTLYLLVVIVLGLSL
jgi:hypothetical protein